MGSAFSIAQRFGEVLQIDTKRKRTKIIIIVVCLITAVGIWYFSGRAERRLRAELVASVEGVVYRVECTACQFTGEMSAVEFEANRDELGASVCPKCGANAVRMLGMAGSDPEQFREEVNALTTVYEVQDKIETAEEELKAVINEIETGSNAPERAQALTRERTRLETKIQLLNQRWSDILDPAQAAGH